MDLRGLRLPGAVLLLLGLCACDLGESDEPTPEGSHRKAMVLGLDGLRGDGIPAAETPRMDQLIDRGAWTLFASTQHRAPTMSGPGWTSILTGVDADKHGIYSNGGWANLDRSYPTFLARAHELQIPTATAIHWTPIQVDIIEDGVVDEAMVGTDEQVADGMAELAATGDYDLHFVHFDDIDGAGHSNGFSPDNPDYISVIETTDEYIGRILDAIESRPSRSEESWLVVLTSDHGGLGTGHGGVDDETRAIPLIVSGDGVTVGEMGIVGEDPGDLEPGFVSQMDVHPTVMDYLGFPPEAAWNLDGAPRGLAP